MLLPRFTCHKWTWSLCDFRITVMVEHWKIRFLQLQRLCCYQILDTMIPLVNVREHYVTRGKLILFMYKF